MTLRERKKLQRDFFEAAGSNTAAFCALIDTLSDVCFYMKDTEGRIMALNKSNCDLCNIHDELDAIGLKNHLSPTRSNGLLAMVKQMRIYALAFKQMQ